MEICSLVFPLVSGKASFLTKNNVSFLSRPISRAAKRLNFFQTLATQGILVRGKHGLNYSECTVILPTLNSYKSFKVRRLWIATISLKSTSIEIIFVKYDDQNKAITNVNEICKFHINPCKQTYANSHEI